MGRARTGPKPAVLQGPLVNKSLSDLSCKKLIFMGTSTTRQLAISEQGGLESVQKVISQSNRIIKNAYEYEPALQPVSTLQLTRGREPV
jgi:hypothetical protein